MKKQKWSQLYPSLFPRSLMEISGYFLGLITQHINCLILLGKMKQVIVLNLDLMMLQCFSNITVLSIGL